MEHRTLFPTLKRESTLTRSKRLHLIRLVEQSVPTNADEYETYQTPTDQLKAQIERTCLNQLQIDIKVQVTTLDPAYLVFTEYYSEYNSEGCGIA